MKKITTFNTVQGAKRSYKKPQLTKHGKVAQITLKAGSVMDLTTMVNDQQR